MKRTLAFLISVAFVAQSEDAFAEDRFFVDGKGVVTKMIRTGSI